VRRPHKNFSTLVEAFALLAGDVPHNLVFVGPADSRFSDKARQTTVRLGLERRVRFLNWVPEEHLAGLYTLADGIVLPSLMEGFGLPALEAMACGTPVIASESTSYQDIVGQAGLLVDPRDSHEMACAIEILIRDPELRRRLSAASLVQASQFTWDRVAHRLQRTFEGVFDVQRGYKVVFEKGD
jgi:glycosyltransferase involved in cell wall biosynthesis